MIVVDKMTGKRVEAYPIKTPEDVISLENYIGSELREKILPQAGYHIVNRGKVAGYYSLLDFSTRFEVIDDFHQIPKCIASSEYLMCESCDDMSSSEIEELTLQELIDKLEAIYGYNVIHRAKDINLTLRLKLFSDGADAELFTKQLRIETDEEFEQRKTERYYELQNRRSERVGKFKKEATALGIELTEDQLKKLEN